MLHSLSFTLLVLKGTFSTEMTGGCRNAPNRNSHTQLTLTEPSLFCPVPQTKGEQTRTHFSTSAVLALTCRKVAPATTESGVRAVNRGVQRYSSSLGAHGKMPCCFLEKEVKSFSCGISLVLWGTEQPLVGGKIRTEGPEDANKCPLATSHS